MKTFGTIVDLAWPSTITCYRVINEQFVRCIRDLTDRWAELIVLGCTN